MDNVMYYICYPLGYIMKWCREQVGNYGLAIILFTLVTKLVILPVSVWVHKNSIRMVSIQPEINRLKAKFYGDRERIAEEQTALYRQVGYNPFANSIPLLIQLLLLAAVVYIIKQPLTHVLRLDGSTIRALADAPGVTAYAGVDVSSYQGVVDWPAVKAAGADFAMLRVGFRGYGTGALVEDNAFAQNAADAANAGLTVGVYFYSQAVTEEEAAEEARFVVERLRGTTVSGPIAYDLEFYTADEARTDDLTGEQATQNALAFCDVIRQAGYEPVVYMNLHWAGSMYGMKELAHLPVWLASYGPVPALDRGVTLWQYSESGVVDGIEGPVDLDLWFTKE